jgi:predicted RNA methylase
MFWPPDSPWAPWWSTNKKIARRMCRLAKVNENDVVYDLGSGTGTALIVVSREFGATGIGIEIDPVRYLLSKIRFKLNNLNKKVKIIRKNFHEVNISKASVVFVYLVPRVLNKLMPKFLKELNAGTIIVSYKYKINLPLLTYDKKNSIYLYKIKK